MSSRLSLCLCLISALSTLVIITLSTSSCNLSYSTLVFIFSNCNYCCLLWSEFVVQILKALLRFSRASLILGPFKSFGCFNFFFICISFSAASLFALIKFVYFVVVTSLSVQSSAYLLYYNCINFL